MDTSTTPERRLMRPAALLAALSALGLTFTLMVGPALAQPIYATVTDHEAFSEDANHDEYWEALFPGADCFDAGVSSGSSYELPALGAGEAYVAVIVKSGAGEFANTIFAEPPTAGQTVWADTNGNSTFDDEDPGADQGISHIIVCTGEAEESEEASVEESTEASVEESAEASVEESAEASVEESAEASVEESAEASVEESAEASVEESAEASVEESAEASVEQSEEASPEGSVLGGTGTPAPSTPDTAMGGSGGPSPLPTIFFGAILLASLAGLAWVNVQAVRSRS